MSVDFITRLIGMVFLTIAGVFWGGSIGRVADPTEVEFYAVVFGLVGALTGLIITPMVTTRPMMYLRNRLVQVPAEKLIAGQLGLLAGLILAALLTFPISRLPEPFGYFLPFVAVVLFGYLGVAVFSLRSEDIFNVLGTRLGPRAWG